jgi:hypothetical protein
MSNLIKSITFERIKRLLFVCLTDIEAIKISFLILRVPENQDSKGFEWFNIHDLSKFRLSN